MESISNQENKEEDSELIIKFLIRYFDFIPHAYQGEFLTTCAHYKRVVGIWCRQSGKSTCVALYALYKCLTEKNFSIMVVAPTQEQSSEMYSKLRRIAETSDYIRPLIKSSSQTELIFQNDSRIKALPCGPEGVTIRGYTADIVIIEESGYIKDSIVNEVILPMIASDQSFGQVIKIGTPKGKNHFWESCYGKETNYKLFHNDWKVVVGAGQIKQSFIDEQRINLTEMEFQTEYEAKFIEDADSYFKQSLIDSCVEEYEMGFAHPKSIFILGVDFARLGEDSTCFIVIEQEMNGKIKVNFIEDTKHKLTTDAIGRVKILNEKYNFEMIYLDETGLGAGPTDVLMETMSNVEGLTFTLKSKQDLYSNLKKLMEQGKLKIPNVRKLLYQLADLRYEVASSGDLKIHHAERGHDDFADALALACWYFKDAIGYAPFIV